MRRPRDDAILDAGAIRANAVVFRRGFEQARALWGGQHDWWDKMIALQVVR